MLNVMFGHMLLQSKVQRNRYIQETREINEEKESLKTIDANEATQDDYVALGVSIHQIEKYIPIT